MQIRFFIIIIALIFLEGCTSPLEKFIFTPLTTKELDKIVKQDKSFLSTYSLIEEKSNKTFSSYDTLRFKSITYQRLHNYIKEISNKSSNTIITSDARSRWIEKYNKYNRQTDSIVKYWENYLIENSPNSLSVVEYQNFKTEKIRVLNKIVNNIRLKFKIKALKFSIDSLFVTYYISDTLCRYRFSFDYKRKIRDSVITNVIPNSTNDSINLESLLGKQSTIISAEINSVFSNGKCFNLDSLTNDIPSSVFTLISSRDSSDTFYDETVYRDIIIKEFIDPSFPSQEAFIKNSLENYHKNLDTLVYNYINYNQL